MFERKIVRSKTDCLWFNYDHKSYSQFGLANAKGAEINPHAMQNKTFVSRHSLADAVFPSDSIAIPGPI